ncbi:MAG TPA: thiolase family protein [Gammaproteobacteria bacterium]|nr:thiolase family protein [Gammaproteobacteria bacterium]
MPQAASRIRAGYGGVAVTTPVTFGYAKRSTHGVHWHLGGVLRELLRRSGIDKGDIDGLIVASYMLIPDHAATLAEYFGMSPRLALDVRQGGASGVIALRHAARAVQSGDADVVACIAGDVPPQDNSFTANFSTFARDHVFPHGAGGPNVVFALITANYMRQTGARAEDFGRLCVAQRTNGSHFPGALLSTPLTLEEYLAARPISEPLRLYDCVMRCCGAEGFLVMSEERASRLNIPWAGIAAAIERHNGAPEEPVQEGVEIAPDRDELWRQASLGPRDMRFVQAYDDYPVIVMMQLESLGFCGKGEAARIVRERDLTVDGDLPLNTNGGMLALGQAGAAGGFVGMTEGLRQVTGQALGRAVRGATAGLVSGYGTVNYDRGICSAAAVLRSGKLA